jgi:hypothetical protein
VKTPALVAVEQSADAFAALFAVAAERGVRVGWLDLGGVVEPPPPLSAAASAGAAKAVAVGAGAALAWKRRVGAPVLRDLLREQFLGYGVVLVAGRPGSPRLIAESGSTFRFEAAGGSRHLDAAALLDELLRPRHRA